MEANSDKSSLQIFESKNAVSYSELIEFDTFWTTTGRRLVDRTIGRSLVAWLQLYSSRSRNLLQYNAS